MKVEIAIVLLVFCSFSLSQMIPDEINSKMSEEIKRLRSEHPSSREGMSISRKSKIEYKIFFKGSAPKKVSLSEIFGENIEMEGAHDAEVFPHSGSGFHVTKHFYKLNFEKFHFDRGCIAQIQYGDEVSIVMVLTSLFNPKMNRGTQMVPTSNPNMRTKERIYNSEDDKKLDANIEMFIYSEAQQALSFNKARGSVVSGDRKSSSGGAPSHQNNSNQPHNHGGSNQMMNQQHAGGHQKHQNQQQSNGKRQKKHKKGQSGQGNGNGQGQRKQRRRRQIMMMNLRSGYTEHPKKHREDKHDESEEKGRTESKFGFGQYRGSHRYIAMIE